MKLNTVISMMFCLGVFMQQTMAQQTEIEYDSGTNNPQLLLKETGAGSSFIRLQMENQEEGHWTLAARSGNSSDFNIFYENAAGVGLNYINIDPTDDIIRFNKQIFVDEDINLEGVSPNLNIRSDATGDSGINFGDNGATGDARIFYDSSEDIFKIGTSAPINSPSAININGNDKVGFDIEDFSSTEALDAQVTIRANSGNSTTPAHLELYENNNSGFPNIHFTNFGLNGYWQIGARSEGSTTSPGFMHFTHSDTGLSTAEEDILTINGSDTRIGVGDATPEYTVSMDISAGSPAIGSDNGFNIEQTANDDAWTFYVSSTTGNLQIFHEANTTNATNPIIRGSFSATNGAYSSFSDRRLKKNISTLTNQLDKVMQLRPTKYLFKTQEDSEGFNLGLIAQEVKNVFPEVVGEMNGEEGVDYMSVSYTELIPALIGAIQDQQAIIDAQSTELASVKAEFGSMSATLQTQIQNMIKAELAKTSESTINNKRNARK